MYRLIDQSMVWLIWMTNAKFFHALSNEIRSSVSWSLINLMLIIDCWSTVLRFFSYFFPLQLCDPWFVDSPLTEPVLCQSDWLTVTSICSAVLNYPHVLRVDAIASKHQLYHPYRLLSKIRSIVNQYGASIHFISSQNTIHSINWSVVNDRHAWNLILMRELLF